MPIENPKYSYQQRDGRSILVLTAEINGKLYYAANCVPQNRTPQNTRETKKILWAAMQRRENHLKTMMKLPSMADVKLKTQEAT